MDITNRKIKMFRAHVAQQIGAKSQNAFTPKEMGAQAEICQVANGPVGIWMKTAKGTEHVIGFQNIEICELEPEDQKEEKKKPGRPIGS